MKVPILITALFFAVKPALADDIQALGDEFNSDITRPQWTQLNDTEGWNANQLELWDLNPSYAPGHMVMAPHSSAWFMDMRGVLVYKEITGNFIVTMRMRLTRRGVGGLLPHEAGFTEQAGAPSRQFSLAGIFARNPRNITHAAPSPVPTDAPSWPPPAADQPDHFTTDWTPDGENYLFLSFGSAGNQGNWQYEVKTTSNGNSNLYFNSHGIPADNADAQLVTLQMIRIGNTIITMRKHADGPWIVENRYTQSPTSAFQQLPNFGDTLQIGITTYTDWNSIQDYYTATGPGHPLGQHPQGDHAAQYRHNYSVLNGPGNNPDLIAYVDYYRFQRPHANLTEADLLALPITFQAAPLGGVAAVELPAGGTGLYLGDHANTPAPGLDEDSDSDGLSNLLEAIMGSNPAVSDAPPISPTLTVTHFQFSFPHTNHINGVSLEIQRSTTLASESWETIATRSAAGWSITPPHEVMEDASNIHFNTPLGTGPDFYRVRATAP